MRLFDELRARLGAFFRSDRADREHQEEVEFHLEMSAGQLVGRGLASEEARRQARAAFGGVERTREEARDARGTRWLDDAARDIRYASRQLRRTPGFTLVAIFTLAIGIGANTAIFSVVDGVLLRPVPLADPDRLVVVWETDRRSSTTREPASWPDFIDLAREARTLSAIAGAAGSEVTFTPTGTEPLRVSGMMVTQGYFALVGALSILGRTFTAEEDSPGGNRVVVLGEQMWRTRFDGDSAILGRTILVDDQPRQVVGVVGSGADFGLDQIHARADYHGPYTGAGEVDAWVPMQGDETQFPRTTHPLLLVGRLAPSATLSAAQKELDAIAARLEQTYPVNAARGVNLELLRDVVFGPVRPVLNLLLGAVLLVLLVACVNVANLLLARGAARSHEVALRGALGASFSRLGRQFMVESVLLTVSGAALGALLAFGGLRLLLAMAPIDVPRVAEVGIDAKVLAATLLVSLLVGLLFGTVPMVQAFKLDTVKMIKGESRTLAGGRGQQRFRSGLVVAELALSVMLVLSAGLLLRSFWSVLNVDPGFRAEGVLKAEYQLPETRYPRDFSKYPAIVEIHRFNAAVLDRVRVLPGVQSVAIAGSHPLDAGFASSFSVVGREAEGRDWPEISVRTVSPDYFPTMGLQLRSGRALGAQDAAAAPLSALINEAATKRFFGGREAIGNDIRFWGISRRIVGVVADERFKGLTEAVAPAVYVPVAQAPTWSGVLLVRTSGNPAFIGREVQQAITSVDPQLAVYGVEPMSATVLQSIGQRRFVVVVLGSFAAITLILALIGVYGVLNFATSQRTREIGIRLALGATRGDAATLVVKSGMTLAVFGTMLGLVGAFAGSRFVAGLLFGVTRSDPITYFGVAFLVLIAALLATGVPALRAARVLPTDALRME